MTSEERAAALETIASEVRVCTRCRLAEGRTNAVPGEGSPDTEVVFVGEGPGQNEDRQGRPFVGAAGSLLEELLAMIGWARDDVFITNVVKCRPPNNRDPEPDEIAACQPFLRAPAAGPRPGSAGDAGALQPADVHARRSHQPRPRHRATDRPYDRCPSRHRLRPLSPSGRIAPRLAEGDHAARHGRGPRGAHPGTPGAL